MEPARPEEQPHQSRIRFRVKRIRSVDHHCDLPPVAAQPYRHGQKLGFAALRRCSSYIEQCAQPRRAETDVDLGDPHLDPFDQGGEDSTLAWHWQLGPALPDFGGPRDKPLLR